MKDFDFVVKRGFQSTVDCVHRKPHDRCSFGKRRPDKTTKLAFCDEALIRKNILI